MRRRHTGVPFLWACARSWAVPASPPPRPVPQMSLHRSVRPEALAVRGIRFPPDPHWVRTLFRPSDGVQTFDRRRAEPVPWTTSAATCDPPNKRSKSATAENPLRGKPTFDMDTVKRTQDVSHDGEPLCQERPGGNRSLWMWSQAPRPLLLSRKAEHM